MRSPCSAGITAPRTRAEKSESSVRPSTYSIARNGVSSMTPMTVPFATAGPLTSSTRCTAVSIAAWSAARSTAADVKVRKR